VNWSSTVPWSPAPCTAETDMATTTSITMHACRPPWAPLALYSTPSPQRARGQGVRTRTPVITSEWKRDLEGGRMMGRCAWVWVVTICLCLGGGGVMAGFHYWKLRFPCRFFLTRQK
jgi:hypothetical protein